MGWRATTLSAVSTIRLPGVLDTTLQVTQVTSTVGMGGGGGVGFGLIWSALNPSVCGGGGVCPQGRVSTEFRRHIIPSVFFTSVYSVFRAELAEIPRNSAEFRVV
jgi:hypothetical protein